MNEELIRVGGFYEFLRYFMVSVIALVVDYITYLSIIYLDVLDIPFAAAVGYFMGMIISYLILSKKVFTNGWLRRRKHYEIMLFIISGFFGIAITYLTAKAVVIFIGPYSQLAKLLAVIISFGFVYVFRKLIVFRLAP